MAVAVAQQRLAGFGPLEVQMNIVFPGKAHTAVNLPGLGRIFKGRLVAPALGDTGRFCKLASQLTAG